MDSPEILLKDGHLWYDPHFFPTGESDTLLAELQEDIAWRQESVTIFGRKIPQPRLTAWYGDPGKVYSYSGLTWNPLPWTPALLKIKTKIESVSRGASFNSVLLNLYRNGQDSMGWHSDDEPELGKNPVIASVSFGESRNFQLRHRLHKKEERHSIVLAHGSLLIMLGETQHFWQHQVPKTAKTINPRVNLTFRWIL
ncbi:MAG: alpha-ketoglutarate-dependent dioxygenase AlkB [Bacteroidia bacterium]